MPFMLLLLLPALEIYLFIKVGAEIGAWAVMVWLVAAVFLGVNILRFLGATAMLEAARKMQSGAAPAQTLADALIKAIAAILLIIPGFASDFIALLLFIPPLRHLILKRWINKFAMKTSFDAASFGGNDPYFGGNVYDHDNVTSPKKDAMDGQVLEHKPNDK